MFRALQFPGPQMVSLDSLMLGIVAGGNVSPAVVQSVIPCNAQLNFPDRATARLSLGIVGDAILRAKLAIDLRENCVKLRDVVWKKHSSASHIRNAL